MKHVFRSIFQGKPELIIPILIYNINLKNPIKNGKNGIQSSKSNEIQILKNDQLPDLINDHVILEIYWYLRMAVSVFEKAKFGFALRNLPKTCIC